MYNCSEDEPVRGEKRSLFLSLLVKIGQWAEKELTPEDKQRAAQYEDKSNDGENYLAVLAAVGDVQEFGFGQVVLTIKDRKLTHIQTARSYRIQPNGGADPLVSRER